MQQQSFWGMDNRGLLANQGSRLVYFLLCHFRKISLVKIGFTNGPMQRRLSQLECGNPQMEVLGTMLVRDGKDDHDLHKRFAPWWYKREWFHATPELLAAIHTLLLEARLPRVLGTYTIESIGEWMLSWDCPQCQQSLSTWLTILKPGSVTARATCTQCLCVMALEWTITLDTNGSRFLPKSGGVDPMKSHAVNRPPDLDKPVTVNSVSSQD